MSSFLDLMVRSFGLNRVPLRDHGVVDQLRSLVDRYPRGEDLLRIYIDYNMGWRTYSLDLSPESDHYAAGDEVRIFLPCAEAIVNGSGLHPFPLLIGQGYFPLGEDAIGSGDEYVISLADQSDFTLYCLYDREVGPDDPRDAREFMVKVADLADPNTVVREPPSEEPPAPPRS